jgi:hypothetical protein
MRFCISIVYFLSVFSICIVLGQHLLGVPVSTFWAFGQHILGLPVCPFWAYRLAPFGRTALLVFDKIKERFDETWKRASTLPQHRKRKQPTVRPAVATFLLS